MRTVFIMVEGQTEEEFVNNSLAPYLRGFGIVNTIPILLETSPGHYGGDMSFKRYQQNAMNLLNDDPEAVVTSLIDFFRLETDYPGYVQSLAIADKNDRVDYLEQQITTVITSDKFIPYIQLHEFEGLLFSATTGFDYLNIRLDQQAILDQIIQNYPNPELINDGPHTNPAKRLRGIVSRYKKTFHGPLIALENGMASVMAKCPRFNAWVQNIIAKAS